MEGRWEEAGRRREGRMNKHLADELIFFIYSLDFLYNIKYLFIILEIQLRESV